MYNSSVRKIIRFFSIYGFSRTLIKIASRLNNPFFKYFFPKLFLFKSKPQVSLIGCGQFGFSTISYFLLDHSGKKFLECYDINHQRAKFCASFFGYSYSSNAEELINNIKCKIVYIASNHHSHTSYAITALQAGKDVYIEKPIAVNFHQFNELKKAIANNNGNVYAGYNRPFSKAVRIISKKIKGFKKPISLNCFVSGHDIPEDHWYRNSKEGTRICGNMGHWIDLMIHLMAKRGYIPQKFEISISYSYPAIPDDNISISITTEYHDITTIFVTSRVEPFEGINETINLQCGNIIAKIDDFRKTVIWENEKKISKEHAPKDVGHKLAINQPFFKNEYRRDWKEIEISTFIMLKIAEMVKSKIKTENILITF